MGRFKKKMICGAEGPGLSSRRVLEGFKSSVRPKNKESLVMKEERKGKSWKLRRKERGGGGKGKGEMSP